MQKDRIVVDLTPYTTLKEKIDAIKKAVPYELFPEEIESIRSQLESFPITKIDIASKRSDED